MINATKVVSSVTDFYLDWSGPLSESNTTISNSTWSVPSGITLVTDSETTTETRARLSGGTLGATYNCVNTVTTADSQTWLQTLRVLVVSS